MRPDESDLTILRLIQADRRIGLDALADECGLSVPSVQRRLKRLRESDCIQHEAAVLSGASFGYGMTFIVQVELERGSVQQLDLFDKRVRAEPQVQQ